MGKRRRGPAARSPPGQPQGNAKTRLPSGSRHLRRQIRMQQHLEREKNGPERDSKQAGTGKRRLLRHHERRPRKNADGSIIMVESLHNMMFKQPITQIPAAMVASCRGYYSVMMT